MVFCQYLWRFYIGCNTFQQSEIISVVTISFLYPFATTSVIFAIFIYLLKIPFKPFVALHNIIRFISAVSCYHYQATAVATFKFTNIYIHIFLILYFSKYGLKNSDNFSAISSHSSTLNSGSVSTTSIRSLPAEPSTIVGV